LLDSGSQPEEENALSLDDLNSPSGVKIILLPKLFGNFSIEFLKKKASIVSSKKHFKKLLELGLLRLGEKGSVSKKECFIEEFGVIRVLTNVFWLGDVAEIEAQK
jgi:hypothetical protein